VGLYLIAVTFSDSLPESTHECEALKGLWVGN